MKPTSRNFALAVGAAATSAIVAIGVPLAIAAPTAAPPSDGQGYINSTARCTAPDSAVLFGTTGTSRVAICKTPAGAFEYRGVRVSDGAKLIVTATQSTTDTFVAKNDGVTYMVTPTALSVTIGGNTLRTESWVDFHGAPAPAASGTTSSKPSTSSSAAIMIEPVQNRFPTLQPQAFVQSLREIADQERDDDGDVIIGTDADGHNDLMSRIAAFLAAND